MSLQHRVVMLSDRCPSWPATDVLDACYAYPTRNGQSGVGGKLVCFGEQYTLLLEGPFAAVNGLVRRLQRDAAGAGFSIHSRATASERAFCSWAIEDVYADEFAARNPESGDRLTDLLIDLLSDATPAEAEHGADEEDGSREAEEARDPFAEIGELVSSYRTVPAFEQAAA